MKIDKEDKTKLTQMKMSTYFGRKEWIAIETLSY